jgi:hypothetical protein
MVGLSTAKKHPGKWEPHFRLCRIDPTPIADPPADRNVTKYLTNTAFDRQFETA